MSETDGFRQALSGFTSGIDDSSRLPLDKAEDTLLLQMDEFFSLGRNTERIRRFIEDNDAMLALVAADGGEDTNSKSGLQLYQLFRQYAELVEGIVKDFIASREKKEEDVLSSLLAAIQKEWDSSENAYRLLCTSYIAASLEYKSFLEFVEDLFGTMHYSMEPDDDDLMSTENSCSGSGYGFDDVNKDVDETAE